MAVAGMNLGKRFGRFFLRTATRNAHLALTYAFAKRQLHTRDGEVESRQHDW